MTIRRIKIYRAAITVKTGKGGARGGCKVFPRLTYIMYVWPLPFLRQTTRLKERLQPIRSHKVLLIKPGLTGPPGVWSTGLCGLWPQSGTETDQGTRVDAGKRMFIPERWAWILPDQESSAEKLGSTRWDVRDGKNHQQNFKRLVYFLEAGGSPLLVVRQHTFSWRTRSWEVPQRKWWQEGLRYSCNRRQSPTNSSTKAELESKTDTMDGPFTKTGLPQEVEWGRTPQPRLLGAFTHWIWFQIFFELQ